MDTKGLILYLVAIVVLAPLIFVIATQHPPAPIERLQVPASIGVIPFGGGNLQVFANLCAGKVRLTQGSATLSDSCFTGDTNIVICSDITSANPARCAPGKGTLIVEGHANDEIAFARMR